LTLDEAAQRRWQKFPGCTAIWVPEPLLELSPAAERARTIDVVLFGKLSRRKGVERLMRALELTTSVKKVVLAGSPDNLAYADEIRSAASRVQNPGLEIEIRDRFHTPEQGLELLASARCAAVAYEGHWGMSRVLIEASAVETPIVAHDHGQIAGLVRRFQLGRVIDADDPRAYANALDDVVENDRYRSDAYVKGAASAVEHHAWEQFAAGVRQAVVGNTVSVRA